MSNYSTDFQKGLEDTQAKKAEFEQDRDRDRINADAKAKIIQRKDALAKQYKSINAKWWAIIIVTLIIAVVFISLAVVYDKWIAMSLFIVLGVGYHFSDKQNITMRQLKRDIDGCDADLKYKTYVV
jgi:Flp pilus assembly protein TadB